MGEAPGFSSGREPEVPGSSRRGAPCSAASLASLGLRARSFSPRVLALQLVNARDPQCPLCPPLLPHTPSCLPPAVPQPVPPCGWLPSSPASSPPRGRASPPPRPPPLPSQRARLE